MSGIVAISEVTVLLVISRHDVISHHQYVENIRSIEI